MVFYSMVQIIVSINWEYRIFYVLSCLISVCYVLPQCVKTSKKPEIEISHIVAH